MNVSGTRTVRAPAAEIWDFLMTPERLRGCLPGCERFEPNGPDNFDAELRLGVGFLKGSYHGYVRVTEQRPHTVLGLAVAGSGALGSLTANGTVLFDEQGEATHLTYIGSASVGGKIAALGERVITATTGRLIGLFFDCLASKVEL